MTDHPDIVESNDSDLPRLVFEAIGYASMCWDPKPSTQVFGTTQATECAEQLIADVRKLYAAEITRLRAEADALRKDAERYRWLKAEHGWSILGRKFHAIRPYVDAEEVFDESLDAAIAATKEQQA
jgi:hypothetical protein